MIDPWTIPTVGLQAYEHRQEIASAWDRVVAQLLGDKATIAVTGMPGVGKTVLLDHLTGKGLRDDYQPPGKSIGIEKSKRHGRRLRLSFRTIPGQESPVRVQGLDSLFNAKRPVAGLIHVVANGYSQVRSEFARDQLEDQMTLREYRLSQHAVEVNDLLTTLSYVRGAMRKQKHPFWILVAVNKADLYSEDDQMNDARGRYEGHGPFVDGLTEFEAQAGADNVQWEAHPVSTWSESFSWRDEVVRPGLDRLQQLQLLHRLTTTIEQHVLATKP